MKKKKKELSDHGIQLLNHLAIKEFGNKDGKILLFQRRYVVKCILKCMSVESPFQVCKLVFMFHKRTLNTKHQSSAKCPFF